MITMIKIFILTITLRIILLLLYSPWDNSLWKQSDALDYAQLSKNSWLYGCVDANDNTCVYRLPLLPIVIKPFTRIDIWPLMVVNAFLYGIAAVLIYKYFGAIPSLLFSVSPSTIVYSNTILTEPLYTLLLSIFVIGIINKYLIISVLSTYLLTLTRPDLLLFFMVLIPLYYVVLLLYGKYDKATHSLLPWCFIFFLLAWLPYSILNYYNIGYFGMSTSLHYNMYHEFLPRVLSDELNMSIDDVKKLITEVTPIVITPNEVKKLDYAPYLVSHPFLTIKCMLTGFIRLVVVPPIQELTKILQPSSWPSIYGNNVWINSISILFMIYAVFIQLFTFVAALFGITKANKLIVVLFLFQCLVYSINPNTRFLGIMMPLLCYFLSIPNNHKYLGTKCLVA
jgi:hypothetical protein